MKSLRFPGCLLYASLFLASLFPLQTASAANRTWLGGGADDFWNTLGNWNTTPAAGDSLIFAGTTRLNNTNDFLNTLGGITFNTGGFTLNGNPFSLTTSVVSNSVGTNVIGMGFNWGLSGYVHAAPNTELVISGVITNPFSAGGSNIVFKGGGNIRFTGSGGYLQESNNPAFIINGGQVIVDGATVNHGGGLRISSDSSATAANLILTNGATFNQTISAGAVRVGDTAGLLGQLIIDNSTFTHAGGNIAIGFTANSLGTVKQTGGIVSNAVIVFNQAVTTTATYDMVGGTLYTTQIRKNSTGTATMSFDGSTVRTITGALTAFFTGLNTAQIKAGGLTINDTEDVTVAQVFTGVGRLTKTGSGTTTVSGASTHSGGITVNGGTMILSSTAFTGGLIVTSGTLRLGANMPASIGTMALNAGTIRGSAAGTPRTISGPVTLGGNATYSTSDLTFSGAHTLTGNRTLTVNNTNTISGIIGETGGTRTLTKAGTGILILSANNTYSGGTLVTAGTLRAINSTGSATGSGATIVTNTGTVTGTGQVGALTSVSGGKIAPGDGVGTLTVTNAASFGLAGVYQMEMTDASSAAGVGHDLLSIQGALDIAATSGSPFVIDVSSMSGLAANFDNTQTNSWIIATAAGGITGFSSDKFVVATNNFQNGLGANSFSVSASGNNLVLTFATPPEITVNPIATQTVASGANVSISATVTGSEPITYSWTKDNVPVVNGGNISGADTATLTLSNVQPGDSGSYVLTVFNAGGSDVSSASQLNVLDLPSITIQPVGATNSPGANFNPSVSAAGGGTLTYQWKKNDVNLANVGNISGANSSSLTISGVSALDVGNYTVSISNEVGDVTSSIAALAIQAATTNVYVLARTDLATGKPDFSPPHGTGTNAFGYDWDSTTPDIGAGAPSGFGYASFAANVSQSGATEPDRYRTLRIGLQSLFGRSVTLSQVAKVSYQTKKETAQSAVDWRLTIYTTSEGSGDNGSWYRSRLQAFPTLVSNLNAPAGQWNVWNSEAGDNQFQFEDNRAGFGVEDMALSEITSGPVTRGANTHDYTAEEVMMIDITLGANNGGGDAISQLDAIVIRLADGSEATLDLEEPLPPPVLTSIAPSAAAVGGAGFTLTVNGSDFESTSVVQWDGADRVTTFINSSQLTASILSSDIVATGTVPVTVQTPGGGTSASQTFAVLDAPSISVQPMGVTLWTGANFNPSVSAAGGGTLTYQWKKNDVNLANVGNISGANSSSLTISGVSALDAGNYTVSISNEVGDVTSSIAALAIQAATTNVYVLARTDLATGKPDFSPPHGAGTNAFGYDWDSTTPDIGAGAPVEFGCASFAANVSQSGATEADRYRTLRIGLRTLFGRNVTLSQVAKVSYQTKKETAQSAVDWRLTIYTTSEGSGDNGSWYRSRLQAFPTLVSNLNAPAGQWNVWNSEAGDNQFQFEDNRAGFGVEDMALSEITSGPVTRGANTHDYTAEEVMMIDITLGANNGGGDAISQLDAIVIRLADGSEATLDLEEPLAPPPLSIVIQSPNVVISWPEGCTEYILEEATELGSPTVWVPSTATISTLDQTHSITVPEASAPMFYRLRLPE